MNNIKTHTNLSFSIKENGDISLASDSFSPVINEKSDFWRMHLDDGENRELGVYSSKQKPKKVASSQGLTTVFYDSLIAEDSCRYEIDLTVYIKNENGVLKFSADIENRADTRINEFQLPFIEVERISAPAHEEVLYLPDNLGMRYENPREFIASHHSEYMASDYKNTWYIAGYPIGPFSNADMSMPWLGIQSAQHFLYLGKHDTAFRAVNFCLGVPPRNTLNMLCMTISQFPALVKGERAHVGECVLTVFDGDWRDGAAYYKDWASQTWYKEPRNLPWVKELTGWQRIILKHQYGEIYYTYNDLPRLYEEGKRCGINSLLVFGWWKGRFDNNYPEYEVDPKLGGEEALTDAISKIHDMGGRVFLYTNGNLIDTRTDYYKQTGHKICAIDIDGNPYFEHYRFSNNGSMLKTYGYKTFATGCHGTNEWKERLLESGRLKLKFKPDAIFYDQLACSNKLCFNAAHLHKNRIDEEPRYRLENIKAINSLLGAQQAFGTEWALDRTTAHTNFTHGCGSGASFKKNAYPDLFRHTFPEAIMSNRLIHDEKADFKAHLNYAFVSGFIFDVAIYRSRAALADVPKYAEYLKYLIELKEKYHEFFYLGRFESAYALKLPENVRASKFVYSNRYITAIWNDNSEDIELDVFGRLTKVEGKSVAVAEGF